MFKHKKRGQQGGGAAAVLVALIGLFVVLYIIFLPQAEREDLLGEGNGDSDDNGDSDSKYNKTLLLAHPGNLDYLSQTEVEHRMPSLNLYTKKEGEVLKELNSMYLKHSLFTQKYETLRFDVDDPANTENALISFLVDAHDGVLSVDVNENNIFNKEIETANIEPIKIPEEHIKQTNEIVFKVSGPGFAFWKSNEYILQKVTVTADVADISGQESTTTFIVEESEKNNLKKAYVKFFPDCVPGEVGKLVVNLNNQNILSAVPDCGILNSYEFLPHHLVEGENRLEFRAESGRYLIDQIKVKSELKQPRNYIYDFELDSDQYSDIVSKGNKTHVNLTMLFENDDKYKEAEIIINDRQRHMETKDKMYYRLIDDFVKEGYNYIKIVPKSQMYIVDLKVEIRKRK